VFSAAVQFVRAAIQISHCDCVTFVLNITAVHINQDLSYCWLHSTRTADYTVRRTNSKF